MPKRPTMLRSESFRNKETQCVLYQIPTVSSHQSTAIQHITWSPIGVFMLKATIHYHRGTILKINVTIIMLRCMKTCTSLYIMKILKWLCLQKMVFVFYVVRLGFLSRLRPLLTQIVQRASPEAIRGRSPRLARLAGRRDLRPWASLPAIQHRLVFMGQVIMVFHFDTWFL